VEPDVILMDEPLGALDRQLRKYVQLEIRRLHVSHGRTTIYVTHDQEEALVMSDRIGVMREGQIVQVGSAAELYEHPKDTFVASFLGESNLIRGTVREVADGRARLDCPQLGLEILGVAAGDIAVGQRAAALIRPEKVRLANGVGLYGVVSETVYLGEIIAVKLELPDGTEFWARDFAKAVAGASGKVRASWDEDDVRILPIT
jgi:ABC-type Fe3+/spermidine/putrescine transport system ATPase subunit